MKRIVALLQAGLIAAGLAACSQSDNLETMVPLRKPVSLEVVTSYGGDDGNRSNYEKAVASYEEKTGNLVKDFSAVSNEEWKTEVLTDFITGSEPDVLFYFTNADADPFINAGKVVSVEEIRETYPDYGTNMREDMFEAADDGKHYALPSTGFWETMFANQKVLEQCGVSLPGPDYTWEQFLKDCEQIKQSGFTPIACSLFEIPHYWFEFMVMNNGSLQDHQLIPELDEHRNLIDNATAKKWIAALEDIKMLYQAGYFPQNTLTATDAETVAMFAEGKAAFLIDGSWKVGYFTEYYPDQLDDYKVSFVPGKGERQATQALGGISMGYFITRKAWDNPQKREAAVEFVKHMTSENVLSQFVTTEVTALKEGAYPEEVNVLQKSAEDTMGYLTGFTPAVQDGISGEAKKKLFYSIQEVVTGNMTAAEAVEAAMKLN